MTMMRFRLRLAQTPALLAGAFELCAVFFSCRAGAEPSADDRALATALFQEGRRLMSDGQKTAQACPKLEESHRLDPSGGTILNLALCHEQAGLLARSWSEFHEAISLARRDGRSDREQAADSHIRDLEPRLSRLTIIVPESVRVEGLRIERDGRELGEASWSTAMPVDGGEHIVRATAPGKEPFTTTVVIGAESDARTVEIPAFTAAPAAPPAPAAAPLSTGAPLPLFAPATPSDSRTHSGRTQRTVAWSIGAAGLVEWGVAGYFGLRAFRKHADSNSACPNGQCTTLGVTLNDESRRAADASTVLAITGLATVVTSVYLLLTAPKNVDRARAIRTPPRFAISNSGSTIVLQSRF